MAYIKKFSELVTESSTKAAEIQEVVKKLGYDSLEEIQREKSLLTKLESLMKELGKTSDVSEDGAAEIQAKAQAKGEPKSLANKMGEKEEDGEPGASSVEGEVAEDVAKTHDGAEPETGVVTQDQEIEEEPEVSAEDPDAGVKIPKARIMSFEEFVKEQTVNKTISYRDDAEEEDDALPVAERKGADGIIVKDNMGRALAIAAGDVANYKKGKDVWASDEDGEEYEINIDDTDIISEDASEEIEMKELKAAEPKKHAEVEGEILVTQDQEIEEEPETAEDNPEEHATVVVEKEISSEKEFEEYAMTILKKSHPDNFDQEIADQVVSGLKSKYKGNFGAMVGALQSSMGK
jgi:hypothetical protein